MGYGQNWGNASANTSLTLDAGSYMIVVGACGTNPDNGNILFNISLSAGTLQSYNEGGVAGTSSSQKCGGGGYVGIYTVDLASQTTITATASKRQSSAMAVRIFMFAIPM